MLLWATAQQERVFRKLLLLQGKKKKKLVDFVH